MKLNRTIVIGGITGGIILIISSYLMFRGNTNETNTNNSPSFMSNFGKNVDGDYFKDGKSIGPVFGGSKKRKTTKNKKQIKKYNRTINKNN